MKFIFAISFIVIAFLVYSKITHVEEEPYTEAQYLAEYGTPEQKRQLKELNKKELILLSTTWCGACKQAKRRLKSSNISYIEYDAETSAKGRKLMEEYNAKGYPTFIIGDESRTGLNMNWIKDRL